MSWSAVSAAVLPLVGVALGTSGTLIGQFLATRRDGLREEYERGEARRLERKEAIVSFLAVAQRAEELELEKAVHGTATREEIQAAVRELWLAKKVVELTCAGDMAQAAHDYAWELHKNLQPETLDAMPERERTLRIFFLERSRTELGFSGQALIREQYSPNEPAS